MATKVLIDDRYRHRGAEYVSINPKLSRLLLYKKGYEVIKNNYGQDAEYAQILTDKDRKNFFWLKPCDSDATGAQRMDRTSQNTRTLSIRALLKELKWKPALKMSRKSRVNRLGRDCRLSSPSSRPTPGSSFLNWPSRASSLRVPLKDG